MPTKGLEGVVAANSSVCYIDGDAGVLAYRGIDIHELAVNSTFEETCYLLWFGRLPKRAELDDLKRKLAEERKLDPAIYDMMRRVPKTATPMEVVSRNSRRVKDPFGMLRSPLIASIDRTKRPRA